MVLGRRVGQQALVAGLALDHHRGERGDDVMFQGHLQDRSGDLPLGGRCGGQASACGRRGQRRASLCLRLRSGPPRPHFRCSARTLGPPGRRELEGFAKLSVLSGLRNFLIHSISCKAVLGAQQNGVENTESSHISTVPHYQHPHHKVRLSHSRNPQVTPHDGPKSTVGMRGHLRCCTFYGLGRMHDDLSPLSYRIVSLP